MMCRNFPENIHIKLSTLAHVLGIIHRSSAQRPEEAVYI